MKNLPNTINIHVKRPLRNMERKDRRVLKKEPNQEKNVKKEISEKKTFCCFYRFKMVFFSFLQPLENHFLKSDSQVAMDFVHVKTLTEHVTQLDTPNPPHTNTHPRTQKQSGKYKTFILLLKLKL